MNNLNMVAWPRATRCWISLSLGMMPAALFAQTSLDLAQAERTALENDPTVQGIRYRSLALEDRAVSAAQLPDPKLKIGAMALPTDNFDLDQEPMTQLQIGVQQRFLPGRTLEIKGRQLESHAAALSQRGIDQELLVLRSVREDFLEVQFQRTAKRIIDDARDVFDELLTVTKDSYATGRTQQQDVFRAELELSRLEDRATRIAQSEETARSRLAVWTGDLAYGPISDNWPSLPTAPLRADLMDSIDRHPRLRSFKKQVTAAELGIDVAREQYKPGWMIDFTYGDRSGQNMDGSARADFLSAMVTVDLPVFRGNRQDRNLAASSHDFEAATAALHEAQRQLHRAIDREWAVSNRLRQRLDLFSGNLLPEAAANSEASRAAYQTGVSDFTTLMRARITEYELQLEQARIRTDLLISQARLLYLSGEKP